MTTKATRSFTLLGLVFAVSLQAASIDATRTHIDAIVGDIREASAPAAGYYVDASGNTSDTIVGGTGSKTLTNRYVQNLVYRYALPQLDEGQIIDSFSLNFQIYQVRDYSNKNFEIDTYLLDEDDPVNSGSTNFYMPGSDGVVDPNHPLIGSHYIEVGTTPVDLDPPVNVTLSVNSGPALTLLQSFYGGDHIPDQSEVAFRFNLDDPITTGAVYNLYRLTSDVLTSGFTLNTAAPAAAFYWDGSIVDTTNGASDGGDGTWDTTTTNWDGAAWNNANNDIATFGGTAGTVTLGENITVGGLQFDAAGYLIQDNGGGETLTFGTAGNIAANQNAEISATVAGSSDITKTGAGTLTLSGDNTFTAGLIVDEGSLILSGANGFTGGLTINNAGRVELGDPGALNSTAGSENAVTFGAGGTGVLSLNGNSVVVKSLDSDATTPGTPVVENGSATTAATLTIGNSTNQASTFAGTIQDGGDAALSLVKAGTGQLTLTGTNSFTGGVDISGGTLEVTKDSFGSGDITFSGDGTLRKVRNSGGASRTFPATGDVGIDSGVTATFAGGSYYYSYHIGGVLSGDDTTTAIVSVGSNTDIRFDSAANTFAGAFQVDGAGRATVNSLADSTQRLYISSDGGQFILGSGGAALTFDNRPIQIGNNAYIINNASSADSTITMAQSLNATIGNNSRTLYLGGSNTGDNTFAGVIGDSSNGTGKVSLYKQDSGTWILTGANTYGGTTTIAAGTLQVGDGVSDGALGAGNVTNNGALSFNVAAAQSVAGDISGSGSLAKTGTGTLTLNGANTYSGGTTITGGNIVTGGGIGSGSVAIDTGAELELTDSATIGGTLSGDGALTVSGGTVTVTSDSSGFGGATSVDSGSTLIVNGSLGGTTTVGGTLMGMGSMGSLTISTGGTLAVGNSPGTLTVGELTLADGANETWEIDATGYDQTIVTSALGNGDLTFDGVVNITIVPLAGAYFSAGQVFELFTYDGDLTGFNPATTFAVTYGGNAAKWITQGATFADTGTAITLTGIDYIPEPSTALLAGLGLAGLCLRRRRRSA
ncbi:MAG: autotransporter-associated beta strand repeat-containing protein [Lentisphaeria bacterium]|nr:autotransporter-associated beta strand repeat-containing protein [Lentisphaeria bacterium]